MRYVIDHDFHIHSFISSCSNDPLQTPERILSYAKSNGMKRICLTDHFWDSPAVPGASNWYLVQDYDHIAQALPLPGDDDVEFLFGCETELDMNNTLGISKETMEKMDYIVIPTTHMHMRGFTVPEDADNAYKSRVWVSRLDAVLDMDLPFHKVGIAHLACDLMADDHQNTWEILDFVPRDEMHRIFAKAAKKGCGIEINRGDFFKRLPKATIDSTVAMFRIAKEEGCKFYLGSDAHHPEGLDEAPGLFDFAIDNIGLTEDDKFILR